MLKMLDVLRFLFFFSYSLSSKSFFSDKIHDWCACFKSSCICLETGRWKTNILIKYKKCVMLDRYRYGLPKITRIHTTWRTTFTILFLTIYSHTVLSYEICIKMWFSRDNLHKKYQCSSVIVDWNYFFYKV